MSISNRRRRLSILIPVALIATIVFDAEAAERGTSPAHHAGRADSPESGDSSQPLLKPATNGHSETVTVTTGVVTRRLALNEGRLRTHSIRHERTGRSIGAVRENTDADRRIVPPCPEFVFKLLDGSSVTSEEYRVVSSSNQTEGDKCRVTFRLEPDQAGWPEVEVEYTASEGETFLRKRVRVLGSSATSVVDAIVVEALEVAGRPRLGGFGQPLFFGQWFAGLEYPAGHNDVADRRLSCVHYPGKSSFESKWAVVGSVMKASERVEDAFERYLDSIRVAPRPLLQYNGWFDLRGDDVNPQKLGATFKQFENRLLTPFSLGFDAFVIDDGYQEPKSVWAPNGRWPDGFAPLADEIGKSGSRPGLWLPLNGYHLDTAWGEQNGFERSNHRKRCYCLAGANYNQALRTALAERIHDGRFAFLKHDFNFLRCSESGHGHLPTDRHGLEANVDAQIELLDYERQMEPEIATAVTSDAWPSPWWLMSTNVVWMGSADYGHDWSHPVSSHREAEMTFRDGRLYELDSVKGYAFPISSYMTHGIIRGRFDQPTGHPETLADWADYIMMFFGRGTMLHELYISPDLMPTEFWAPLGKAVRWARSNAPVLRHTRMVGGDPRAGEVYGYIHWSEDKGILCLRNPSRKPRRFQALDLCRPARFHPASQWHPVVVYPQQERLETIAGDGPIVADLPPASVVVIELFSTLPDWLNDVPVGKFHLDESLQPPQLIIFNDPGRVVVMPRSVTDDQKKSWAGVFDVEGSESLLGMELTVNRQPGGAVAWKARAGSAGAMAPVAFSTELAPAPNDWDRLSADWPGGAPQRIEFETWLPPSPFYPERATFSVGLKLRQSQNVFETRTLSSGDHLPEWPAVLEPNAIETDVLLADHVVLERRRSRLESAAWFFALGVLLPAALCLSIARATLRMGGAARYCVQLLVASGWVLLCFLTPLGRAIARALM